MFELPELPYAKDALAPNISGRTLEFHYEKHHAGYLKKLNKRVKNSKYADMSLEKVIKSTSDQSLFNNAAQTWNHAFYWHSMSPKSTKPSSALSKAIKNKFGGMQSFQDKFRDAATGQFGSGWAWLVADGSGNLAIETTGNAKTPVSGNQRPLLVCDVWEHAYYLDYQNARPTYVDTFIEHLLNWDFVAANFAATSGV